jgi:hypothetical protein
MSVITLKTMLTIGMVVGLGILPGLAGAQNAVGTLNATFYDADRDDRAVPVDLYYPAQADGSGQPPADPPPGGFPVVAVGHGYLLGAGLYAWVGNGLAAAGFVVAVARTGGELFPSHETFGLDLAFLTRALQAAGDDPDSPFFGRISDRSAVLGHSMGGGCSFLAAASDPQITAVAGFAPAETDPSAIAACAQIMRPALIFAGGNDCVTPPEVHQIPMYEALAGGWRTLVTVAGASHCQWAASSWICELGEGSCPPPTISRAQQQGLTLDLLQTWLMAVLMEDGAAQQAFQELLDTTEGIDYEQAGLSTSAPMVRPDSGLVLRSEGQNPFAARLHLGLEVRLGLDASAAGPVTVEIFDVAGRRVRTLPAVHLADRAATLTWDGRDTQGRDLPAGVYLVRARSGGAEAWLRTTRLR